jgi:hypothetical protein
VEFIFAQFSPTVCLPCKQTDLVQRIIALFKVLLYRVSSKKLLKIENTRPNQLELEFSFSFDRRIMKFITTTEAGKKWDLSSRRVGILCSEGRIPGVQKAGNTWLIPDDAEKPADARIKSGKYIKTKKEVNGDGCSN